MTKRYGADFTVRQHRVCGTDFAVATPRGCGARLSAMMSSILSDLTCQLPGSRHLCRNTAPVWQSDSLDMSVIHTHVRELPSKGEA